MKEISASEISASSLLSSVTLTDGFVAAITDRFLGISGGASTSPTVGVSGLGLGRQPLFETLKETLIVIQNWGMNFTSQSRSEWFHK